MAELDTDSTLMLLRLMTQRFTREVALEVKLIVIIVSLNSVNIKYSMLCHAIQGGPVAVTITTTLSTCTPYKTTHNEIYSGKCSSNSGCLRHYKILRHRVSSLCMPSNIFCACIQF